MTEKRKRAERKRGSVCRDSIGSSIRKIEERGKGGIKKIEVISATANRSSAHLRKGTKGTSYSLRSPREAFTKGLQGGRVDSHGGGRIGGNGT